MPSLSPVARRFHLATVRGIPLHVDPSFAVVALFFAFLLATSFLPESATTEQAPQLLMSLAALVGVIASIVVVEIAHTLAARRVGVAVHGISLFLLGGVAEMSDEPKTPRDDLLLALAGPATALALALSFHSAAAFTALPFIDAPHAHIVLRELGWLNALLAAFNLLPAFPHDGGRVLRAILWKKGNTRAFATELAAGFGKAFGVLFIVIGVLSVLFDGILMGAWWAAIGWFLRRASRRATSTLVAHQALEGEPIARFVRPVDVTVPASATLRSFREDIVFAAVSARPFAPAQALRGAGPGAGAGATERDTAHARQARVFAIVDERGLMTGTVRASDLKRVSAARLDGWQVARIATPVNADTCIAATDSAVDALAAMGRSGLDRVFVVEAANGGERLVGVVHHADLLDFVTLKLEVEGALVDTTYDERAFEGRFFHAQSSGAGAGAGPGPGAARPQSSPA